MPNTLPISRLVHVSVNLAPSGAQAQNLSTLLLLGSTAGVIDSVERFRDYADISAVAIDFGTSAPEYLAAALWFEQVPQPTSLKIGRWINAVSSGGLKGAALSAAQQALSVFTAVSSGGFTVTKDAGSATNVAGINLSGAANLNAVAALLTAAAPAGITFTWNPNFSRFEAVSATTGAASAISFLTAPGSGTDLSATLGMRSTSSGAYKYQGQVAETAADCITLFDVNYGQNWYAAVLLAGVNSDHLLIAPLIEAMNNKHLYGVTSQEAGVLVAATTTDIAYQLKQFAYKKTITQYSSSNPYAVVSALARQLTVDYGGNNTTITLMYKQEPGITPENMNATQIAALEGKNCNVFVAYNNDTAILEPAKTASGLFIDVVTGTDWLAIEMQTRLYNLLYTSPTKVPQTDAGTALLVTTCEGVLSQGVANGLLAPGTWQSGGFGILAQNDFLPKGFYVYAPKVATQSQSDRAARKSVPIQIAAKLAGAVHEVFVAVTVNQ